MVWDGKRMRRTCHDEEGNNIDETQIDLMGSHYYTKDGELIDGDLRLCRKLNGFPSPTTVLNILGSPGLKYYFRRQMFEAACTTPASIWMIRR